MLGSRIVRSGQILSGQVGPYHLASGVLNAVLVSGATSTRAQFLAPFVSGSAWAATTQEVVSGVRAVALSLSGNILVAMAGVSGRMPALGLVVDNATSGAQVNLYTAGVFQLTSGLADYSGYLGQQLFVGRSGQVVTISGSFNSGGLLSGDALQPLGYATNSGGLVLSVAAGLPLVPSLIYSGNIGSGSVGWPHLASGLLSGIIQSGSVGSGSVIGRSGGGWTVASGSISQSDIAAGGVGSGNIASGAVSSGMLASGLIANLGGASLTSGAVQSGHIASGSVEGFFGPTRQIASGSVGVWDLGSGAVIAGALGSGAVQSGNIASGVIASGMLASGLIANLGGTSLTSGAVQSGHVASGAVQGFFGSTRQVASGTLGVWDLGSGAVITGAVGSGAVQSGNIASGQVGVFHLQSGLQLSGLIQSGGVGSGAVMGQPGGGYFNIASGTVGANELASGSVLSGTLASGQVGSRHISSGATIEFAHKVLPFHGGFPWTIFTQENISGARAVSISPSGRLQVAMASVSGRMPAIGFVIDSQLSGASTNVYALGDFQLSSGMADFSGYVGQPLYVGRSGQIVTSSGSWNSGGLQSGDLVQYIGVPVNSGAISVQIQTGPFLGGGVNTVLLPGVAGPVLIASGGGTASSLLSGIVQSGHLASGAVQGFFGTTPNIASGTVGVWDLGSGAVIAGALGSGAVLSGNIASGQVGQFQLASGSVTSGNIASGAVHQFAIALNSVKSGLISSGCIGLFHLSSGLQLSGLIWSGGVGSGAVKGSLGGGYFTVASGTVGPNDLASGSVLSGAVASGTLGSYHLASGTVVDRAQYVLPFSSGLGRAPGMLTGETVSGVRAVAVSQSGFLQVAMASVSGRMPAVGVVLDNVASGIQANVFSQGDFQPTSGLVDYSGVFGQLLYVGRSGQVVTASGWFNSGGLLSGDVTQPLGNLVGSGWLLLGVGALPPFVAGPITSGNIGSGQVGLFHLQSGLVTSGLYLSGSIGSGQIGLFHLQSGLALSGLIKSGGVGSGAVMGQPGAGAFNIASGTVGAFELASGAVLSGHVASGQLGTAHIASGTVVSNANYALFNVSGLKTGEAISGVRAVNMSLSGFFQIAMTNVSGRMPVVGVVTVNLASGDPVSGAACFTQGTFQLGSGISYFPVLGTTVFAGRSGHLVTFSGSWNSGGFVSGDIAQSLGVVYNSGGLWLNVAESWPGGFALSGPSRLGFF